MIRVYVAGPYSKGDPVINVRTAIDAANRLLELGYAPYIPHLTMFWHLVYAQPYEKWLELDFEWIKQCDILLRLPGESSGADREVVVALENGLDVYYSIEDIIAHSP